MLYYYHYLPFCDKDFYVWLQIFCPADVSCLPISDRCNGRIDCRDESDEAKCNKTKPSKLCRPDDFHCADGSCIKKGLACNKVKNCPDGSDEKYCGRLIYQLSIVIKCF